MHKNFKITSLEIDDLEINFDSNMFNMESLDIEKKNSAIFTSVLIGENGVGKSRLLKYISYIFIDIYNLKYSTTQIANDFKKILIEPINNYSIEYEMNHNEYVITKHKGEFKIFKNFFQVSQENYHEIQLPNNILCCAFQINDKFKINSYSEFYKYLGIKSPSGFTNSRTVQKKICDNIIQYIFTEESLVNLEMYKRTFKFLGLDTRITLDYKIKRRKSIFIDNINVDNIRDIIYDAVFKNGRRKTFASNMFSDIENDIPTLNRLVNQIKNFNSLLYRSLGSDRNISTIKTEINLATGDFYAITPSGEMIDMKSIIDKFALDLLNKLDIIDSPILKIKRDDNYPYSLGNGSSGEIHILFLISNIISNIKDTSLIFIDEPEISLHPSWQMKITNLLKEILSVASKSCHIIIATHSHFIVSNLEPKESTLHIIRSHPINGQMLCENIDYDIYGWSTENILYRVFGVPSNRNYYLAEYIDKLLEDISLGNHRNIIENKEKLISLQNNLSDVDPFKEIIEKMLNFAYDKEGDNIG